MIDNIAFKEPYIIFLDYMNSYDNMISMNL